MVKGRGGRSRRWRLIEPRTLSWRGRGNTAAFTIESSYRARLEDSMVNAAVFPRARIERLPGSIGRRRRLRLPGPLDVRPARHACRPVSGRNDPAAAMFQGYSARCRASCRLQGTFAAGRVREVEY